MAKIMLVDDAAFMRMMIKKALSSSGYNDFIEAQDGAEAVKKYSEEKPDMVIMDITMPNMDGLQALKKIREGDPNAKVVMCTAMGQESMVVDAIKSGARDFVVKPFDAQRIVKTNYIDCVAAINDSHSRMSISLINKNSEDGYEVELSVLGSKVQWNTGKCYQIYHDDFEAYNTRENPENVSVKEAEGILNGQNIHLNPHSITVIVVELEK